MSMVVPTANNRFPIWQIVVVMMLRNGFAVIFPLTIWQSISMQPLFSTRRDRQVSKEAYYTILGVLEDGSREVLSVVNHPTEGALCWKDELDTLKDRGVKEIGMVISDALTGIENAVCAAFPCAAHQFCVAHLKRQIINSVAHKDKPAIASELSEVFRIEDNSVDSLWGYEHFVTFVDRWEKKYPTLKKYKAERNTAYFTDMDFLKEVQRCIYTTNWIERLNRKYKRAQ